MQKWQSAGLATMMIAFLSVGGLDARAQDPGASGELEMASTTTPKQKLEFTRTAVVEMQEAVKKVTRLLEGAEKEGDTDEIQCVRKKLASIKALLEVSERAQGAMKEALSINEAERAEHEFRKVAVAIAKVRQFVAEAEACVGAQASLDGETEVEVSADALADDNETAPLLDSDNLDVDVEPPPTSPFE